MTDDDDDDDETTINTSVYIGKAPLTIAKFCNSFISFHEKVYNVGYREVGRAQISVLDTLPMFKHISTTHFCKLNLNS